MLRYQEKGDLIESNKMKKDYKIFRFIPQRSSYDPEKVRETFSEEEIDYYKVRAKENITSRLKAIYCDVIYEYDYSNHKYASCSIDAHLESALFFFNNEWDLELANSLDRALRLSIRLKNKQKIIDSSNKTIEFIDKIDNIKRFNAALIRMIQSLLNNEKFLNRQGVQINHSNLVLIIENAIEQLKKDKNSYHMQRGYLDILLKIWKNNEENLNKTKIRVINTYVNEAEEKKDTSPNGASIAAHFYQEAINQCKKLPNSPESIKTQKDELLKTLSVQLREFNKIALTESHPITFSCEELFGKDFVSRREAHLEIYEDKKLKDFFKTMSYDKSLLPSFSIAEEMAKSYREHSVSYHLFSTKLMQGDTYTKRISEEEEKKFAYLKKRLFMMHMPCVIFWTNKVFDMIKIDKEIDEELIMCLSAIADDEDIDIIEYEEDENFANALISFLSDSDLISDGRIKIIEQGILKYSEEDYVSAIHILVFQIEGIIRDICEILGLPTLTYKDDKTIPAMFPIEMLNHISDIDGIDEDLLDFIKVYLYDTEGKNYRNNIAHSLLEIQEFNKENANILLLILIKLAKYEIKTV